MRQFLNVLCLVFMPAPLLAQAIDVRGGEHDGFTRLVFALPTDVEWKLSQGPANSYRLETDAQRGFQLDSLFSRIGTDRISAVRQTADGAAVEIDLSCACVAEADLVNGRMLIVDVKPGVAERPATEPVAAEAHTDMPQHEVVFDAGHETDEHAPNIHDETPPVPEGVADVRDLAEVRINGSPGIGPGKAPDPLMPNVPLVHAQRPASTTDHAAPETPHVMADRPLTASEQIIADLAAAATQGLLDPAILPTANSAPVIDHSQPDQPHDNGLSEALAGQLAEGLSGLDHESKKKQHLSIGAINCVSDRALRIGEWGNADAEPFELLSESRSAVFGEFDRVDASALRAYLKMQVYYALGTESRAAAQLDTEAFDPVLNALSYLVELHDDPTDVFANQVDCDGSAALWSVLDMKRLPNGKTINTQAVLRSFETLPRVLREQIGPRLADKLSEFGARDTARDVLRRLERTIGEETESIVLGRAKLDVKDGNTEHAGETLRDLALSSGPNSIEAIKAAVELAEQKGDRIPKVLVELAAAYATEMRNTDEGTAIWETYLRMLLLNGEFDAAFVVLEDSQGIPEDVAHDMGDRMLEALLPSEDEVSFLKYAFRLDATGHRTTQPELDLAVARRMLDLGLSEAVLERLARIGADDTSEEVRLLKARAELQQSRPSDALAFLGDIQSDEAIALRAEARSMLGDHADAQQAFASIGDQGDALKAAWLSGDWDGVANATDSPLAPAAQLINSEQTVVDPANLSLNAAEALATESANARDTLRALLEATQIAPEQ